MPETISSRNNPLARQIRSLRQRRARDESGLFLVEGIHHVGEAIQAGWEIESLAYAPELLTSEFGLSQVEDLGRRGICCIALKGELFAELAGKDNPTGILAVTRQRSRNLEDFPVLPNTLGAACISPQDPGNVGTILRTLDAMQGAGLFLLDGGVELYHPSLVRASMGSLFWKPVIETTFDRFVAWVRSHGFLLIGSSAHATLDYRDYRPKGQPMILLLGNEQKGLNHGHLTACDAVVSVPMKGRVSSLNLAVAAGVLLYSLLGSTGE